MDSVPNEERAAVASLVPEAPAQPAERKIKLRLLHPEEKEEQPVELSSEMDIPSLIKRGMILRQQLADATDWVQAAKDIETRAKQRLSDYEEFTASIYRDHVAKVTEGHKEKYAEVSLASVGWPEVRIRIRTMKQKPSVVVDDEALLKQHYMQKLLPTDTVRGPYTLIPESWSFSKAQLNDIAIAAHEANKPLPPGVRVVDKPVSVFEEPVKPKKREVANDKG